MIDHIGYGYSDYARAKDFFTHCLAPLGAKLLMEVGPEQNTTGWAAGFGRDDKPNFWIGEEGRPGTAMHVCFVARSRAEVRAFYEAAINAGATDNGGPGIREIYHPNYYAAFVRDFDGHNIEAVCHAPA